MRELWRLCQWGMAAAAALAVAVFAGTTDAGIDRAHYAALQLREIVIPSGIKPARPLDAIEGRKLAETVRVLSADRERLLARIAALEHNVDDMTGSITRFEKTVRTPSVPPEPTPLPPVATALPQTVAPARTPAPANATPIPPQAALTKPADEEVTSAVSPPDHPEADARPPGGSASGTVTKRQFGLDLGGSPSEDPVRAAWDTALRRHGTLLKNLRPMMVTREHPRGGMEYRLIAGPIGNAAKAARFCAAITGTGGACQPAMYEGQKLAGH